MTAEKQNIYNYIKGITVVIPVYNSESTLESLHERLCIIAEKIRVDYEIIFIDDGYHFNMAGGWVIISHIAPVDETDGPGRTGNFC